MNGHTQSGIYDLAQTPSGEIKKRSSKKRELTQVNKGLVIKYRGGGGGLAEIGGGSSIIKLTKRGGSPKYWSCLQGGPS